MKNPSNIRFCRKYWPIGLLSIGIILSVLLSYRQLYNFFSGPVRVEADENTLVAKYIQDRTNTDDKIYSYLYGATFYYLTQRDSAVTYTSASYLLLDSRENFGYNLTEQTINQILANRPKFVIMYRDDQNSIYAQNSTMQKFLIQNFQLEKEFEQLQVRKINF